MPMIYGMLPPCEVNCVHLLSKKVPNSLRDLWHSKGRFALEDEATFGSGEAYINSLVVAVVHNYFCDLAYGFVAACSPPSPWPIGFSVYIPHLVHQGWIQGGGGGVAGGAHPPFDRNSPLLTSGLGVMAPFDFDNRSVTQTQGLFFTCDPVVLGCTVVVMQNGQ